MRGIILALVFTLVGKFTYSSKTYLYNYEAFTLNGLPEPGLARTGLRLSCKVEISVLSQRNHLLKIRSPQLEEYNGIWPRDPFIRASKLTQLIASFLTQPFKFEYSNGRVGNIYAPEDTPVTCVNLVRGIVNMLQITIKKSQNAYDLQEAGIGGVCLTRYVVQEDRRNNRVSLTKTRDLNDCQDKVVKDIGMIYIRPCPSCPLKEKIVKGTAAFTYKLKYADSGTLITEAVSQQVYQISPFNEPAGVAVTEARQELTLVEVKNERVSPPEIQLQNRGGLPYQFPPVLLQMPIQLIKTKNPAQRIVETLQQVIQDNQQELHGDAPYKFLELIQLFRVANPDTLESVFKQFSDKPYHRLWLLSGITMAGTVDSLKFLKLRIRNDDFKYIEALLTVSLALHLTKADGNSIAVAAVSTIYRILSGITLLLQLTAACPLHDLAAEAASKGNEDDIVLAMKAIGNAGEPASIKRILKFLPIFSSGASNFPVHIQVEAVMALRHIGLKDSRKVQDILLQIFVDHSLSPEVRMISCIVLFETGPALPLVTTIANVILKETNMQVASFVYSHIKALSSIGFPRFYNVSAACNIAIKLLSPRLDRLSFRYSKVIPLGGYYSEYQAGAFGKIFLINSPRTMFPSALISSLLVNYAGAATSLLEVGVCAEGLTDVVRKQNIPFAEYSTYRKIKEIGKTLLGWRELPSENPLLSAYFKLFGQELAFANINKDLIQQAVKLVTGPADRHTWLKRVIHQIQNGIAERWIQPLYSGEFQHIVPTAVGLPLAYSVYTTALAHATARVDVKLSPPLSGDFRPSQLYESNLQLRADVSPSIYFNTVAMMGINTEYFQSSIEIHTKLRVQAPLKFDAKIDLKEKSLKFGTTPCQQETEIAMGRHKAFAVSRNIGEPGTEKKIPVFPEGAGSNILKEHFKSSERTSREGAVTASDILPKKYSYGPEQELRHSAGGKTYTQAICVQVTRFGCQICFYRRARDASVLKNTYFHRSIGEHEAKIVLKPARTDAAIDKIQLEIQAGSRAASKIIQVVTLESEEEDDSSPDDVVQMKLKKILGIENVFKVANRTRQHKKGKTQMTEFWADPNAKYPSSLSSSSDTSSSSSSSSSSSPSSSSSGKRVNQYPKDKTLQPGNRDESSSSSKSSSSSSGDSSDRSSSSRSSSSSDSGSSSSDSGSSDSTSSSSSSSKAPRPGSRHQLIREPNSNSSSSSSEYSKIQVTYPKFLGDSKAPDLAVILRAIRNDRKLAGFQLVLYTDLYSTRPRIQVFVSNITGSSRWKICADASIINAHKAASYLKWGQDCQDYRISSELVTGWFADHPAIQLKLEWPKVPSRVKSFASWFYTLIPGAAYILGWSEIQHKNPSQQAKLIVALTSPRTCDFVAKLPELTLYNRALGLPLSLPVGPSSPASTQEAPIWNFFSEAPSAVLEHLKARCSVSQDKITTFNEVQFNYSLPTNCYHILAQDCSPELKFLVMMKNAEESADLKAINIKLGSHEIDMYPANGLLNLMVNGVETPVENITYTSDFDASLMISNEKKGLSLVAPDYGIDKLYFDGRTFKVQVAFWMAGKTCGICGKYDAENKQEFQMPSGYVAKDAVSFAHSWILSEKPCAGACKLQRSLVKLEKTIRLEGENSKCYPVEPVLRCVKGCSATETTPVSIGFHCLPADSTASLVEGQMKFDQKSEDMQDTVEAHTACSCEELHT
uniref:Phosvitin n=1 Tax=Chelonoidis abingdonii TaxID=106734 RepID=A0A8C0FX62_CHEAB